MLCFIPPFYYTNLIWSCEIFWWHLFTRSVIVNSFIFCFECQLWCVVLGFYCNIWVVYSQLKFSICVRCNMAVIEAIHPNITSIAYFHSRLQSMDYVINGNSFIAQSKYLMSVIMDRMQKQHDLSDRFHTSCNLIAEKYTLKQIAMVYIYAWAIYQSLLQVMVCRLGRRQAIIWTNARILLAGPLRTKLNEISIKI